jgi:hypothetical protein
MLFKAWRGDAWLQNIANRITPLVVEYRFFFPLMLVAFGLVLFGTYYYLLAQTANLTTLQGYLVRISPFVLLAVTRTIQTVIVFLALGLEKMRSEAGEREAAITINPKKVVFVLASIAVLLVLAGICVDLIRQITWDRHVFGLWNLFNLNQEKNLPTYFSTFILLLSASLFGVIAAAKQNAKDSYALHWTLLAIIFLLLSIDETAMLHETVDDQLKAVFTTGGIFYYAWVIPAIPLVALFAIAYSKFFFHLPARTRNGIFTAALLYLGGVLGVEILSGWYADQYSIAKTPYLLITDLEEGLEMAGIIILLHSLLKYIRAHLPEIPLRIGEPHQGV